MCQLSALSWIYKSTLSSKAFTWCPPIRTCQKTTPTYDAPTLASSAACGKEGEKGGLDVCCDSWVGGTGCCEAGSSAAGAEA
jgi:hypothetical protein